MLTEWASDKVSSASGHSEPVCYQNWFCGQADSITLKTFISHFKLFDVGMKDTSSILQVPLLVVVEPLHRVI